MFRRRPNPLILSGLAIVAVIVVAAVSGVSLHRVFAHFRPEWIIVVAIAEAVSFLPYARIQVAGLIALEWAVLAPVACLSAIGLLIAGANVMGSLLWPWALCVPAGFALGLWLTAPGRSLSLLRRFGLLAGVLDGVGMLHRLIRAPGRTSPAWLSMTLYWAAEIVALYAALRMFGVDLSPARVVLAYGTGYVVTRRSLPLAGAAITEVLLTFALHWVGVPLGAALAAVVTYRLFNLVLVSVPSLLANRLLRASLAR